MDGAPDERNPRVAVAVVSGGSHSPMAARTSPLTSAPRGPVGAMVRGSMPLSAMSLRTEGHMRPPKRSAGSPAGAGSGSAVVEGAGSPACAAGTT